MIRAYAALGMMLAASACTPAPPLLTLGNPSCDPSPMLATAVPVPLGGSASIKLGAESRCLLGSPPVTYGLFRLPQTAAPYNLTIGSAVAGEAVVAPRAALLDGAGTAGRALATGDFRADTFGFLAGIRPRPEEQFLLVSADPGTLGRSVTLRLSLRQMGGVDMAAGVIIVPIFVPQRVPAQITERPATYSLNGPVRVSAEPLTTVP